MRIVSPVLAACLALSMLGAARAQLAPVASPLPADAPCGPAQPTKPATDLWGVQDMLIGKCLAQIPAGMPDRPNIYTVGIAPLGRQALFAREAKTALNKLAAKYGGTAKRGVLLSNGAEDLGLVPLATNDNIAQVMTLLGSRKDATPDDVLIVYLASHGRPDAALESALPGNVPILAVSADSLAAALAGAHIRKRIIIISACFAGSWIPRLANDDTIVITAARADRTSFGCDDKRPLTYFGEAFLTGPLGNGASLAQVFDITKKTVTQWEVAQKFTPSEPQVSVGRNMQSLWLDGPKTAPKKIAAKR